MRKKEKNPYDTNIGEFYHIERELNKEEEAKREMSAFN